MENNNLDLIPILNREQIIIGYVSRVNLKNDYPKKILKNNIPVVIMAGGKGTRMEPFTKVLPKPLVPVQDKTIIEHIIENFVQVGCNDFYLMVNYKNRILKAYFEELQPNYDIFFTDEKKPLGTAGSLHFLEGKFEHPLFLTNCDIIVKIDYSELYEFHKKGGFAITLVASFKEYKIPYGTCELKPDGSLLRINEKPKFDFLINSGLYVINPEIFQIIPENKFYHITHLIKDLAKKGEKIGVFPVQQDSWIDIGQWDEYKRAINIFDK